MVVDVERPRRLFTIDEYHRMAEAGILAEDERVELIEGEIVPVRWCRLLRSQTSASR